MIKIHPESKARLFVANVLVMCVMGTLIAAFYDTIIYRSSGRGFHLLADLGIGVLFGLVTGLTFSFAGRPVVLQLSFDGSEELFKKVVETAMSGGGYRVEYDNDSLLIWARLWRFDLFLWGIRVQVEQNTATIVGPMPLALRLKNTIEAATLVARWALLLKS